MYDAEKDYKARVRQYEKEKNDRRKKVKRDVRLAVKLGTKVPYSLDTLLEHGIGINTIYKVIRRTK
jgi:hypothetical protein